MVDGDRALSDEGDGPLYLSNFPWTVLAWQGSCESCNGILHLSPGHLRIPPGARRCQQPAYPDPCLAGLADATHRKFWATSANDKGQTRPRAAAKDWHEASSQDRPSWRQVSLALLWRTRAGRGVLQWQEWASLAPSPPLVRSQNGSIPSIPGGVDAWKIGTRTDMQSSSGITDIARK